jgi:hypothetical protein
MSESAVLWIIGSQTTVLLFLIALVARAISAHTSACREWQERFLVEHGEILGKQEMVIHRLDRLQKL